MDSKTIVTLGRMAVGGAIMIASMVTGENGVNQIIALFLMGAPVEVLQSTKKEEIK